MKKIKYGVDSVYMQIIIVKSAFFGLGEDTLFGEMFNLQIPQAHMQYLSTKLILIHVRILTNFFYDYFGSFRDRCHIWSRVPFRLPSLIIFPCKENLHQVNENARPRFRLITEYFSWFQATLFINYM